MVLHPYIKDNPHMAPIINHFKKKIQQHHYAVGLLLGMLGTVLFSAKAIIAKLLYRYQVDAVLLITLRMLFAIPFFVIIAIWQSRTQSPLAPMDRWRLILLGLLGYYLSSFLDFLGLQYISAGLERLILFLTPSFVLLIMAIALKRKIFARQWLALVITYAGIILVFIHDLRISDHQVWLGSGLVLGATISYALYLIGSGEVLTRIGSLRLVSYSMCVATTACLIQFLILRPLSSLIQPFAVYRLSFINAIACTVAPVIMTMTAVAYIGAPLASQAGMIGPVSTLLLGFWLLDEPITNLQLAGCGLVLIGITLLSKTKKAFRWNWKPNREKPKTEDEESSVKL